MNRPPSAKSVAGLLNRPDGPLKALMDRMAQFEALDLTLAAVFPASLEGQYRVTGIGQNHIEISAHSAASATRLRYLSPQIIAALETTGYPQIREVIIKLSRT